MTEDNPKDVLNDEEVKAWLAIRKEAGKHIHATPCGRSTGGSWRSRLGSRRTSSTAKTPPAM